MFRVGDVVTGNELNSHALTSRDAICKVVLVRDCGLMDVVVVKSPHYKGSTEFTVYQSKFKLVRPSFKGNK